MRCWRLIDTGKGDPYMNMAIDEAIVTSSRTSGLNPVMRFYQWERPALTIGYFQDFSDVVGMNLCTEEKIPIVRRITGGRSLLHQYELTYSIISPTGSPLFPNTIRGAYLVIARGLSAGLKILGVGNEIFQPGSKEGIRKIPRSHSCFSSTSIHEITVSGRKIIGSAQRRWSDIFLQQGSIIIERSPGFSMLGIRPQNRDHSISIFESLGRRVDPGELRDAMIYAFSKELGIEFKWDSLTDDERMLAERLYLEKYTRDGWNMEREIPKQPASPSSEDQACPLSNRQ
ncbi:MAG TPA: biotin/lipoate A/B protein ligase family protein [Nitrospiria bacterium]|nr:biotin/lipoate A/B protein ligase family protein [Nitrospiria bacterium]